MNKLPNIDNLPIHDTDWADQPYIKLACENIVITPEWAGERRDPAPNVYVGENYDEPEKRYLYSFNKDLITCEKCKEEIKKFLLNKLI